MSNPHGSKSVELIRFLANKLMSDSQRKKTKNFLYRLQRLPIRMLGIENLIDSQKAEIERLKSRLGVMDGKFNLALYGLPSIGEYKATLISNSLLSSLDSGPEVKSALAKHRARQKNEFAAELAGLSPQSCVVLGLSADTLKWVTNQASLKQTIWAEPDSSRRSQGDPSGVLPTDFINALIACEDASQDLILCLHRFQELTPLEQLHLLALCNRKLKPGGTLCLELPDLAQAQIWSDSYWAEPHCLRPYSAQLVSDVLSSFDGKLMSKTQGLSRLFLFRKSA